MKVIRIITYEGPEEWLKRMLANSLPDGTPDFLCSSDRKVIIETTYTDLELDFSERDISYERSMEITELKEAFTAGFMEYPMHEDVKEAFETWLRSKK